ncbi:nitroreductase/quinone reductase family protein [Kribbella sp. NPDC026611]|uniref:nitroreductase/quinone reductase family protein n=1 Tax=Kribbella sp. NPDC026611 TaxID=3154911 RepID=UPI0033F6DF67
MTKTSEQQTRKPGTPGTLSRWFQRTMNARTSAKIRRGKASLMGMDLLVLKTVGRRSGELRETPLARFADGDGWLVVASGGGSQHPDWHANLAAHPDRVQVGLPGEDAKPAVAETLTGEDRARAWQLITSAQPRYAKYQQKSDREYPIIRLTAR